MPTVVLAADIRGLGSNLEQQQSEHAVQLVERFAAITNDLVEQLGGSLLHVWTDEAFALFRTAEHTARAAVEAHRHYDEATMPGGGVRRVGVGIAAGEAMWASTGSIGRAVTLATRLCDMAGPRQPFADARVGDLIPEIHGVRFTERGLTQLPSSTCAHDMLEIVAIDGPSARGR